MVVVVVGTVTTAANSSPLVSASSSCNPTIGRRARARAIVGTPSPSSSYIPPQLGLGLGLGLRLGLQSRRFLSPWTGGLLNTSRSFHHAPHKAKKRKLRGNIVHASLFGVGAPEALVIGVVALLVFGPKGLAEVARNLGKTLRAFQPTIRELQDVSREFKSTLEREIGLDESTSTMNNMYKPTSFSNENQQAMVDPNGMPKSGASTSEELLKITQDQLVASTAASTEPQSQESSPQEQQDAPPKVIAASSDSDSAAQIQSSEKVDKER